MKWQWRYACLILYMINDYTLPRAEKAVMSVNFLLAIPSNDDNNRLYNLSATSYLC